MRVTGVRTVLVTAPWTGDPFWVPNERFERTAALVVVDTDEGVSGVGETIMGYFRARGRRPDRRLLRRPADRPRARSAPARGRLSRALPALALVGPRRPRAVRAVGRGDGALGHRRQGRRTTRSTSCSADRPTTGCRCTRRAARAAGRSRKPSTQAQLYGSLGFRGLKIGTGFDGRPGGYTTPPGTPPYGTWYAGGTAARVADERAKFGALREALGPDDGAGHRLPRGPGPRAVVALDGARPRPRDRAVRHPVHGGAAPLRRPRGLRGAPAGDPRPDRGRGVPDRRRRVPPLSSTSTRSTTSSPMPRTSAAWA